MLVSKYNSIFQIYCANRVEEFKQKLNGSNEKIESYVSNVNGHASSYLRIKGKSFGFPLHQSISVRFIDFNSEIVTIKFWTPFKEFEKWSSFEDVMTSSLSKIKKG